MPEATLAYIKSNSYIDAQKIQANILNDYVADMIKYATLAISAKIRSCFDSIPAQLAKNNAKFQYKVVQKGGTASLFGEAIDWLVYAGIVRKYHSPCGIRFSKRNFGFENNIKSIPLYAGICLESPELASL